MHSQFFISVIIPIVSQHNQGPAVARNTGVQLAKGDIIAFTDDDWLPEVNWLGTAIKGKIKSGEFVK